MADEMEGKDDSEEEEAELNFPSPALGFSKRSLSSSTSSPAGAPQQFMRPGPSVKSIHAPRSLSMARLFSFLKLMPFHILTRSTKILHLF